MCYKKYKSIILKSWKMARFFPLKFAISNVITDSFLVKKRETLKVARRNDCKNLLNLCCQDSISFGIFQVS